jgi:hypothetical protein
MFLNESYYNNGQEALPAENGLGSVWISGYDFAHNLGKLRQNGIMGICSAVDLSFKYPPDFEQIKFALDDCESQKITGCFQEAYEFIEAQRRKTNVLVHCAAGISRSSAMLISYMMKKYGYSFDESLKRVREKRACVLPNSGFERQLREYEKELKLKK